MSKYMIHACPKRMWYVDEFLIPSMLAQGVKEDDIKIWNDAEGKGNLASFNASMEWIATQDPLGHTWHLQDDIIISRDFRAKTEWDWQGVVCGYCCATFDNGNSGVVPMGMIWWSFPCIRIPNLMAERYLEWFDLPETQESYGQWMSEGKFDDALFKSFLLERCYGVKCTNLNPNIVDHVDYMLGGSVVNKARNIKTRTMYWRDEDLVTALEEKMVERGIYKRHEVHHNVRRRLP